VTLPHVFEKLGFVPSFLQAKAAIGAGFTALMPEGVRAMRERWSVERALLQGLDIEGQLLGRSSVHVSSWLWTKLALGGYILRALGDGTEMPSSVEGRPPFLDHHLFDVVRGISTKAMLFGGREKAVLREALKGLLPTQILRRRKQPLLAPPMLFSETGYPDEFVLDLFHSRLVGDVPFIERGLLINSLNRSSRLDAAQRAAAEPPLVMATCAILLQQEFKLGSGGF
jgi:asparagine synthase (glutamine-hydrolysing)